MTITEQQEQTRDAILDVAAAHFADIGYLGTTLEGISRAAGVAEDVGQTLFASKAELAQQIVEDYFALWDSAISGAKMLSTSSLDALVRLSYLVAHEYQHNVRVRAAVKLVRDRRVIDIELHIPFLDWTVIAVSLLESGKSDGSVFRTTNSEVIARQLVASFFGNQHISEDLADRRDLLTRMDEMWTLFGPAICGYQVQTVTFEPRDEPEVVALVS